MADLSVVAITKGAGGTVQWVLEVPNYDPVKDEWSLKQFPLDESGKFIKISSSGRNPGNYLQVTIDELTAAPPGPPLVEIRSSLESPFQFGGGPETTPQPYIFIEDITMGYVRPDPLPGGATNAAAPSANSVVIHIVPITPNTYEHQVWSV